MRATYLVCHRLISSWKADLNTSLAALEMLTGLARIHIPDQGQSHAPSNPHIKCCRSGCGIRKRFFSGSRIPNLQFSELSDNFSGKKFNQFKDKIILNFVVTKKGWTTNFYFTPLLLLFLDRGPGIRIPGSGMYRNQDPGSGIDIPDPHHRSHSSVTHRRQSKNLCVLKNSL